MIGLLAQQLRDREVSARELVERSLALIEAGNGRIRAVVALRAERALAEAADADRARAAGETLGPLAGLPVLVKDLEDVAGMTTTRGSLLHADDAPAAADGLVPGRLRAAGAIVVGKTNLPEAAFEAYTANRLFGVTRNPWDLDWSPGGSSGGSAAALSAGMVPIATATDGGGSARIPAAFCGLVGLKPTNGIVGRGLLPSWIDLSTDGPMGHSVADVAGLLDVIKGPVAGDPSALPRWEPGPLPARVRLLAAPRTVDWGPLDPDLQRAFDDALAVLDRELGLPVELVEPAAVTPAGNADEDWFTICCTEQAHEVGRARLAEQADRFDPVFLDHMRAGLEVSIDEYLAVRRRRFDHTRALDRLLGDDGVLVTPTLAMTAQHADGRMVGAAEPGTPADALNTCLQNITGAPALSLPAGRLPGGLPFGVQLTGPRFRDDLLLSLGARWEQVRPWPWYAPGFEPLAAQP
ncbi:aspartyl-tRNA(Asn)/glutamyl-tRNA(Gln) amidotransferase subunit A [Modestobacter sp. DSM 44400]|uniref:amidase n=1 Tax=Modestobacter sp. DSM 44400 TaxID=1550230 RepID=UPI000899A6CB|nr:amidase [Modestobacter sp. DSM 44400]SDY05315.1 aspartyl-tRNA(Asn)/glutamyl-tRNA(Gln) amidotransferase subunit A [Modestobacter sp. DSM 44400]